MDDAELVDYDPCWPTMYARLRAALADALYGAVVAIEHVGPTARPGRRAAPVIEVAAAIQSFEVCGERLVEAVERLGFAYAPEYEAEFPGRRTFVKQAVPERPGYRVHVYEHGQRDAFAAGVLAKLAA